MTAARSGIRQDCEKLVDRASKIRSESAAEASTEAFGCGAGTGTQIQFLHHHSQSTTTLPLRPSSTAHIHRALRAIVSSNGSRGPGSR